MKLYGITIEKPEGAFSIELHRNTEGNSSVIVTCNLNTNDPGFLQDIAMAIHDTSERLDKLLDT